MRGIAIKQLTECVPGGSEDYRAGYILKFNYDVDAVEQLKKLVPHTHREWHPDAHFWWVSEEYENVLTKMFGNFEALTKWQGKLL
uniref:Uncharacterized protein n=1 Tax=viral metagenome TaxID=1070528 RepID=A0A6M3KNI4_9ZZZZ